MSARVRWALPRRERGLLRVGRMIVPAGAREDWLRTWEAELWHMQHDRRARGRGRLDLMAGMLCDAMWLRADGWRSRLRGTARLCLASLAGLCGLSFGLALALSGGWRSPAGPLGAEFGHCSLAAVLVVFVSCARDSSLSVGPGSAGPRACRVRRRMFFGTKSGLVLLLAFLLSADLCRPMCAAFPAAGALVQILVFVIFALVALRWAFRDQEGRCKRCLRSLTTPARVGRPSHNLLEWNGTEQICEQGHGLLSVPEMESSWRQYSQWVEGGSGWDGAASV